MHPNRSSSALAADAWYDDVPPPPRGRTKSVSAASSVQDRVRADFERPSRGSTSSRAPRTPKGGGGGHGGNGGRGGGSRGGGGGTKRPAPPRLANPRRRGRVIFLALLFVFTIFAAQLVRLQGIDADRVAQEAQDLRSRPTIVPAKRGQIEDRWGVPLAESAPRYDIGADQSIIAEYEVTDPATKTKTVVGAAGAAAKIAPILGVNEASLRETLTGDKQWVPVAKLVTPTTWQKIADLGIPGVTVDNSSVRIYPGGVPTASTVGWVGADGTAANNTGGGLEYLYDTALTGKNGRMVREYSLDNRVIPMGRSEITPAVPGENIRLTIDQDLNWYAHDVLAKRVQELDAEGGVMVIMDKQGRLLTVAQTPTFDPEDRAKTGSDFSNIAFQGSYEPGSVAKVVAVAAALEEGLTTPTQGWTIPNRYTVDGQEFRDSHDHETEYLTTAGVLAKSSNIGTVQLAQLYPKATLDKYMRAFGMGTRTAVGFPGESTGVLPEPKTWDGRSRYTIAFGQAFTATPVQITGIMQTIVNGGNHIPATIVAGRTDDKGDYHEQPLPQGEKVVSEQTASDLSRMLESVVSAEGTAKEAEVPGFNIAGKTGTSNRYTGSGGYTSSFVGYAPADDPQFVMGVFIVNSKKSIYGGFNAGPVFSKVMSYALQKYGIAPSGAAANEFPLLAPPPGEAGQNGTATTGASTDSATSGAGQASSAPASVGGE